MKFAAVEHQVLITCCFVGRRDRGDPIGQELQGFVQRLRLRAVQGRGKFKDKVRGVHKRGTVGPSYYQFNSQTCSRCK